MKVLTSTNLGMKAARFLVRAGWSRDHINSVLRGDNFIDKSSFQDIQAELSQLLTLQTKFSAPSSALSFTHKTTTWQSPMMGTENATPESAALILRKQGWKPDEIQSVLKTGDKHSSQIDWKYIDSEASKGRNRKGTLPDNKEEGGRFGVILFVIICLVLLFAVIGA